MSHPRTGVQRQTVDLSQFPDLVVIYLGMRVRRLWGLRKLLKTGRQIQAGVAQHPEGLLLHENFVFSFVPPHVGMRTMGAPSYSQWRCGAGYVESPAPRGSVIAGLELRGFRGRC